MKIRNILLCGLLAVCCALTGCSKPDDTASTDVITGETAEAGNQVEATVGNIGDVVLQDGDTIAEFNIEGYGIIKAKLFPEIAPVGVDNFVKLANSGFYDGLTIHRVYKDFMFQGGSLNGNGTGGEAADGGSFGVEISEDARHFYGALCYANAAGSNTCQFYIVNNNDPQDLTQIDIEGVKQTAEMYGAYAEMFEDGTRERDAYLAMQAYYSTLAEYTSNASEEVIAKYNEVGGTPSLDGGYTVFGQVYEGFDVIEEISNCPVQVNSSGELSLPTETIIIKSVIIREYAE